MGSLTISSHTRPLLHGLLPSPSSILKPNTKPKSNIPKLLSLTDRRSLILLSAASVLTPFPVLESTAVSRVGSPPVVSVSVTDRVFMDFSFCPGYFSSDRPIGFDLAACPDEEPIGRVIFGLYGKIVPKTVANFKALCNSSGYRGTLIHKIFPGQFFVAGRQGRREKGEVRPPLDLARNTETVDPKAFQLKHARPGTLSLCLGQNDDDEGIKLNPDYRNVEFLVTTGPGPCPELDNYNVVFGTVIEGMDVVATIANIPTYKPAERVRQFNAFANFLGDKRAHIAQTMWNRPLRTIIISDCGELQVANPSLSPSLP